MTQTPQVGDVWEIRPESGHIRQYVTRVEKDRVFYSYRPRGPATTFDMHISFFLFGSTLIERGGKPVK